MATKKKQKELDLYRATNKGAVLEHHFELGNPVTIQARKLQALFDELRRVATTFNYDRKLLSVFVGDAKRAEAINYFIHHKHIFGKLALTIEVWDCSGAEPEKCEKPNEPIKMQDALDYVKTIFAGSPFNPDFTELTAQDGTPWYFFEFPAYILTYQADTIQNPHGFGAAILSDIVKEAFCFDQFMISTVANSY